MLIKFKKINQILIEKYIDEPNKLQKWAKKEYLLITPQKQCTRIQIKHLLPPLC